MNLLQFSDTLAPVDRELIYKIKAMMLLLKGSAHNLIQKLYVPAYRAVYCRPSLPKCYQKRIMLPKSATAVPILGGTYCS